MTMKLYRLRHIGCLMMMILMTSDDDDSDDIAYNHDIEDHV